MSLLNLTPLREREVDSLLLRVLLHGDSGAGKTTAASTMPRPCFLLTEPNGLLSIRAANPDAIVVDVVSTASTKGVPPMNVVREFFVAALDGTLANAGVQSIVIDSLTELQRILRDEITSTKRVGPNGEVKWTLDDWSTLTDRMRKLVRTIRDLPFHVVAICLSDTEVDDSGTRYVVPAFQGKKLPNEVAGYFNVVGYVFKRSEQNDDGASVLSHRVLLRGSSNYLCKSLPQLAAVEHPRLDDWLARIVEGDSDAKLDTSLDVSDDDPKSSVARVALARRRTRTRTRTRTRAASRAASRTATRRATSPSSRPPPTPSGARVAQHAQPARSEDTMGFMINPNDESSTNGSGVSAPPWLVAGKHVCWAADLTYKATQRGTMTIEVLFACVDGEHAGARMFERFHLTAGASWKLARFARAVGQNEQWDAEDEQETRDILCARPVVVDVKTWTNNNGDERPEVAGGRIDPYRGEITDAMESRVVALEDYAQGSKERAKSFGSSSSSASTFQSNSDIPF